MDGQTQHSSPGQATADITITAKEHSQTNSDVKVGTNDNHTQGVVDTTEETKATHNIPIDVPLVLTCQKHPSSTTIDVYKDTENKRQSHLTESSEYRPNKSMDFEDSNNQAPAEVTVPTNHNDKQNSGTLHAEYQPEQSSRGGNEEQISTSSSNKRPTSKAALHRWLVVLGCFMCNFITGGIDRSDGIFYLKFLDKYKGSALASSWAVSLPGALRLVIGPVSSALSERFSARVVVIIGGFLLFLGFLATGFSPSLLYIYLAFGLVGGVGRSFIYTPGLVVVGQYFAEKPGLAVGVATSGVGAGTFALPPLVNFLFEEYEYWEVFTSVGLICLNAIAFGALLKPKRRSGVQCCRPKRRSDKGRKMADRKGNPVKLVYINKGFTSDETSEHSGATDSCQSEDTSVTDKNSTNLPNSVNGNSSTETPSKKKVSSSAAKFIDISLLSNPCFMMFCVSILLFTSAFRAAFTFLPALAESRGCSNTEAALLMSVAGILDAIGRILCGYILDLKSIRNLRPFAYSVILLLISCASFTCPLMFGFLKFALMFGFYGFMTGSYVSQKSVILVDILGVEKLPSSFGLLLLSQGLGSLIGPPLSGFLKDTLGNYENVFFLGGGMMAGGSVVMVISNILLASQRKRLKEGLSIDVSVR